MRIALDAAGDTNRTQVHIYSHGVGKNIINAWGDVILDELSGTIERARHSDKNKTIQEGKIS